MALFKAMAGANKTALNTQPLTQGYCWFTTEDGKFYIDALANQQDTNTLTRFVLNAEKADKDGDGNIIKNTYLPLTGGTLTGDLNSKFINMYLDAEIAPVSSKSISFYTTNKSSWTSNSGSFTVNYYSAANTLTGGIHYCHPTLYKISSSSTYSARTGVFRFTTRNIQENTTFPYRSNYTTFILEPSIDFNTATTNYYIPYTLSATLSEGTENNPVYLDDHILKTCPQYAGGTAVTLNGTSKGASTASFYAPTTAGTAGQFLKSNGTETPTWIDLDPGVKSISTGGTNGTISVNTNGTIADVAVKGLQSNAYTSTGLTAVQTAAPTSAQYTLWVDTDEETVSAMPLNAPKYKTFSIGTGSWLGSGPFTYDITVNGVTASDAVIVLNVTTASAAFLKAQLDWETAANTVTLSTTTRPTGTVAGYLITLPVTSV